MYNNMYVTCIYDTHVHVYKIVCTCMWPHSHVHIHVLHVHIHVLHVHIHVDKQLIRHVIHMKTWWKIIRLSCHNHATITCTQLRVCSNHAPSCVNTCTIYTCTCICIHCGHCIVSCRPQNSCKLSILGCDLRGM